MTMPIGMPKMKPTPPQLELLKAMASHGVIPKKKARPKTRDEATRTISEHAELYEATVIDRAFKTVVGINIRQMEREMWELSQDGWH